MHQAIPTRRPRDLDRQRAIAPPGDRVGYDAREGSIDFPGLDHALAPGARPAGTVRSRRR